MGPVRTDVILFPQFRDLNYGEWGETWIHSEKEVALDLHLCGSAADGYIRAWSRLHEVLLP